MPLTKLFTFFEHPGAPADNNADERAPRLSVIARKVNVGTRVSAGSAAKAAHQSFFGTWHLRGHRGLERCRQCLMGGHQPDGNHAV